MATYLHKYEEFLTSQMEKGGAPALMEAAVRDYNEVSKPTFEPTELYKTWFFNTEFACSTCNKPYKFTKLEPLKTTDETTCHVCLASADASIAPALVPATNHEEDES